MSAVMRTENMFQYSFRTCVPGFKEGDIYEICGTDKLFVVTWNCGER